MNEYIKKEAVLDLFGEVPAYTGYETYPVGVHTLICEIAPLIKDEIRKIPAADVAPVRHGRWVKRGQEIYCSECGEESGYTWAGASRYSDYCPNCGAKLHGGADDVSD